MTIKSLEGDRDGIRWGQGWRVNAQGNPAVFSWSYDLHNDIFRLFAHGVGRNKSDVTYLDEPDIAARARQLVRERMGLVPA